MKTKSRDVQTRGETTRNAIEDAAIELFMEEGYHATSMRQIADRSGLALGGIYNHFKGKEEIFEALILDRHPYKRILPLVLDVKGKTAADYLRNAFEIIMKELSQDPVYIKIMLIEMVEFNGKHGAAMLNEITPAVLPAAQQLIKVNAGLRIKNPALFLRTFFGMVISYFITEMLITNSAVARVMPKDVKNSFLDIYLHGVLKEDA
jgi:AcrR family transcriptional regulator